MSVQAIFKEQLSYLPQTNEAVSNQDTISFLTNKALIWSVNGSQHQLSLNDVVGVSIVEANIDFVFSDDG
jgi:hypothetical protein